MNSSPFVLRGKQASKEKLAILKPGRKRNRIAKQYRLRKFIEQPCAQKRVQPIRLQIYRFWKALLLFAIAPECILDQLLPQACSTSFGRRSTMPLMKRW